MGENLIIWTSKKVIGFSGNFHYCLPWSQFSTFIFIVFSRYRENVEGYFLDMAHKAVLRTRIVIYVQSAGGYSVIVGLIVFDSVIVGLL